MTKRTRDADESKLSSDVILEIAKEIQDYTDGGPATKKDVFEKKYPEFAKNYHMLFAMLCENGNGFDMTMLQYMLNLRDKIDTDKVSFDNASKEVGQKMFDIYVKPNVPKTPTANKK
jgi:hypothetical protein